MCGSRKYPYHPHGRDGIFQGGGRSICLIFQQGSGGHHMEIFPEGSRDAKECNKEKTQNFSTIIYLRKKLNTTKVNYKEPLNTRINEHILSVP